MKKMMYFCDLCNNELKSFTKGGGTIYTAYEIKIKYGDEIASRRKVKLMICPKCLDEIRKRNCNK